MRLFLIACVLLLQSCAQADVPDARNVNIPNPVFADKRKEAINENPDSVLYLPLGRDVLVPSVGRSDPLPEEIVGPFELRSETVAGALQLILADYEISLAFESDLGLTRTVTVANLRGPLNRVVKKVCALADLYCAYEDGMIVVKETQTFTITIPPISQDAGFMSNIVTGLGAILKGGTIVSDTSTRTIIYEATQRTAELAERYFQRMRSSTALIVFETYIWEVSLNSGNSAGIRWDQIKQIGKFTTGFDISGTVGADFSNPVSIGLPTTKNVQGPGGVFTPTEVFDFLTQFGAVKTISQPQITVLSGSTARLRAADRENFVSNITETINNGQSTTSVSTSSVDTGFTIEISSAWDNATVYADIRIDLTDVSEIENFNFTSGAGGTTTIQLPKTTEREVETQVRIRPGDSLLIAGLVRERDNFADDGPGLLRPWLSATRTATTQNLELVFLLRPRVIVYTSPSEAEHYNAMRAQAAKDKAKADFEYDFSPFDEPDYSSPEGVPMGSLSPDLLDPSSVFYGSY